MSLCYLTTGVLSFSTVALGVLIVVVAVLLTLGIYYVASGDWLWSKDNNGDRRNWPPPRWGSRCSPQPPTMMGCAQRNRAHPFPTRFSSSWSG